MTKPNLGTFGVFGHYEQWQKLPADQLREIEALGYGAIWAGGSPPAELEWVQPILEATTTLQVATGIVNIWTAAAGPVAESFHRIDAAFPNRFILGIGVGHPEAHAEYKKPYDALVEYLDELDAHGVPKGRRVVAALGPQVLKLSARRSAGAPLPDLTRTHRAGARADRTRRVPRTGAQSGPDHRCGSAREVGREALDVYLGLANYVNNWKRLGFTDSDVARPGSDALVDAFVAHGTVDAVAARLEKHLAAGADHVPVQVLTGSEKLVPALADLAGPLGLTN